MVVAQNDQDLAAERGLSSFDRRHSLAADWLLELPIGPGRKWLHEGVLASVIGGWVWSGTRQPRSRARRSPRAWWATSATWPAGVNGTLRANVTGSQRRARRPERRALVQHRRPSSAPARDSFGDAGRNTVIGPGSSW